VAVSKGLVGAQRQWEELDDVVAEVVYRGGCGTVCLVEVRLVYGLKLM